jgi:uncharacterized membrane protein YdbT with pleckstrin-like domain
MDYIRQSLTQDEELVHVAHFHWFYTMSAIFNVVFSAVLAVVIIVAAVYIEPMIFKTSTIHLANGWLETVRAVHPGVKILAFLILLMGVFRYAQMMIVKMTTEIAVTNRRLVYKRGLVARHVGEMNIDRIEGVNVLQGVLGRIFNFGSIMVRGMGIGEVVLPPIADPLKFRRAIETARNI